MNALEDIIKDLIKSRLRNQADLASFKRRVAKKYKIACPSNIELLKTYHKLAKNKRGEGIEDIENLLKTRPVRSLSGIVNISVLTKPYPCPGKCLYCPIEKGIPKSYVSGEPAVERAKKLKYNPYSQVKKRIEMLKAEGHPTDKIELRIVGGTWSYYPKNYQSWFIKRCFDACNETKRKQKLTNLPWQIIKFQSPLRELTRGQRKNEKAKHRIVGLSIETRPDFTNEKEIKWLRELGVTMVELGVQSIYDNVLKLNLRGHGVKKTILATKLLKNAGFKVLYQMMPNLPGSDLKRDEKMFQELFQNPDFQPDLLKIYPCALLKEALLYELWKQGKYKPYNERELINLVAEIKKKIPYYVRIQRITRDIPSPRIVEGGAKISNLRQILFEKMKKDYNPPAASEVPRPFIERAGRVVGGSESRSLCSRAPGWQCKCIRCREVRGKYDSKEKIYLFRQNYEASGGKEIFLSFENKNRTKLYSLLRLRVASHIYSHGSVRISRAKGERALFACLKNTAIIREVHTYGGLVPFHQVWWRAPQHRGLGKKLIKEAEKIAKKEFGLKKIAAISAIGAREYFRKLGYKLRETYMIKNL